MAQTAEQYLSASDPDFASLVSLIGPPRIALRPDRSPYQALVVAVTHQQLHGKAAEAILARVIAAFPGHDFPPPEELQAAPESILRAAGLSAAKIAAVKDIARHAAEGILPDRATAAKLSDQTLIELLLPIRGVGRLTIEMMMIFTLGRPDILPVDDFGVREGYRKLKRLESQPKPRALAEIGQSWSPFRSSAAWYLWRASEVIKV